MTKTTITPGYRVGILGGGQLAQMLALAGIEMGLEMHVLSKHANDPAALVTRHWHQGDPDDAKILSDFFKRVQIVTIESEFLNAQTLAVAQSSSGIKVVPSIERLSEISDRLTQKQWLKENQIQTADFVEVKTFADVVAFFNQHRKIVLKKRRFGYDGYGTFVIKSAGELEKWQGLHANSCHDFIAETFVPFKRELALQLALNERGDVLQMPLVEWQAQDSKCLWVKGPITTAVPKSLGSLASKVISALKKSKYVGVVTFELFDGKELTVNEMAPRVHNSGHYSIEALTISQFRAHLFAILNLALPKTAALNAPAFAMYNLLGTKNEVAERTPLPQPNDCVLHWYGKTEIRAGRKMGHLTATAKTSSAALNTLIAQAKGFKL